MTSYVLSFKPAIPGFGNHDPSAAIFEDGRLVFGVEEERYTRRKHATDTFPTNAIEACLDHRGIGLADVSKVVLPYEPRLGAALFAWVNAAGLAASVRGDIAFLTGVLGLAIVSVFIPVWIVVGAVTGVVGARVPVDPPRFLAG